MNGKPHMDKRFDTNSVYNLRGEQLNGLDAVMRQLCGLRTPTFQEQQDLACKLRSILSGVAPASERAGVAVAEKHAAAPAGKSTASGESLAARVRRAQQRSANLEGRPARKAPVANHDSVRTGRPQAFAEVG